MTVRRLSRIAARAPSAGKPCTITTPREAVIPSNAIVRGLAFRMAWRTASTYSAALAK